MLQFQNAIQLIDKASEAKVDAVKFQTFDTKLYISESNKERFEKLKGWKNRKIWTNFKIERAGRTEKVEGVETVWKVERIVLPLIPEE